ncbi:thiamine phosphate synthase [Staphylospora marina]|uniref:thiamine phosphate synthase n=1 Tax=Staphylospora marina TaxID=2490858 RepID=UPI000F5C1BBF|nr:thiamine phosphate synthase [Staphylospora marina]
MKDALRDRLRLYFVAGSVNVRKDPGRVLEAAIRGGITMFQFREKGENALVDGDKRRLALELKEICRRCKIPFIVNDDVELALEVDADGVHVGQEDLPAEEVRKRIGDKILGVSAHDAEEALQAVRAGADYLGVGPMHGTLTKRDIRPVRGPVVIEEIRRAGVRLPMVGIGGIGPGRVEDVMKRGADGIAVISAVAGAEDPKMAARWLRAEVDRFVR